MQLEQETGQRVRKILGGLRFPSRNQCLRRDTAQHESFWAKVVTADSGILAVLAGLKVTRNRTEGREFWWGPGKGVASNLMGWAGQGSQSGGPGGKARQWGPTGYQAIDRSLAMLGFDGF